LVKVASEDIRAFCQHRPRVILIVTAQAKGKENAMAEGMHASISFESPLYIAGIAPERCTC